MTVWRVVMCQVKWFMVADGKKMRRRSEQIDGQVRENNSSDVSVLLFIPLGSTVEALPACRMLVL